MQSKACKEDICCKIKKERPQIVHRSYFRVANAISSNETRYDQDANVKKSENNFTRNFRVARCKTFHVCQKISRVFVTVLDISSQAHIKMQAVFQKHTDNAVSKTVNLPHDASPNEVKKAYLRAYRLKSKGVTVYRYSSKSDQVLTVESSHKGFNKKYLVADSEFGGGFKGIVSVRIKLQVNSSLLFVTVQCAEYAEGIIFTPYISHTATCTVTLSKFQLVLTMFVIYWPIICKIISLSLPRYPSQLEPIVARFQASKYHQQMAR